ncbi:MAG: hypothetical protein N2253_09150 [Bacteroidia bacterium]|nr:hypothetical protein [Bacteroidia bacterium]MCX7765040.1 hypothetical protein [Bacteroidia bacterium]
MDTLLSDVQYPLKENASLSVTLSSSGEGVGVRPESAIWVEAAPIIVNAPVVGVPRWAQIEDTLWELRRRRRLLWTRYGSILESAVQLIRRMRDAT